MKRIIILNEHMGSGYLTRGKVYDVERAYLYIPPETEDENGIEVDYDKATENQRNSCDLYVEFRDDIGELEYTNPNEEDESYILFKNDKELAYYLIDNVEGLAESLVNIKRILMD